MPRALAVAVLLVLIALFAYAVTSRTTLAGAPRYYPPTEQSKRAHARLAERAAAARAARAKQDPAAAAAPAAAQQ